MVKGRNCPRAQWCRGVMVQGGNEARGSWRTRNDARPYWVKGVMVHGRNGASAQW